MNNKDKEETWEDPIIAEIHARRKALVEECGNDAQTVFNYFLGKQKEGAAQGKQYVNFPSKPVNHPRTGTNNC